MSRQFSRLVFLLVEADDETALDLQAMLERLGAGSVLLAASTDQAAAALAGGEIDMVLADLSQRGTDTLVAELIEADVAVIGTVRGDAAASDPTRAVTVLRMPFGDDELAAAVDDALKAIARDS